MPIRILSAADVRAALPMPKAIDAMRHAYSQLSAGKATAPPRQHISTDKGVTLIMPAYLPAGNEFGIKVVSVYDDNPNLDLPRITATVLVLDPVTGTPKAFMDAAASLPSEQAPVAAWQQIYSLGRTQKRSGYLEPAYRREHSCKR